MGIFARSGSDAFAATRYGAFASTERHEVRSFDGTALSSYDNGDPSARRGVVFLHGLGLDSRIWFHQFEATDPTWRRIFYDARGHGGSLRFGEATPDLATLAADLHAIVDASGLDEVVLVGHSIGGMTVLKYCAEHPGELGTRVVGLVLANTTYAEALRTFALVGANRAERWVRRLFDWMLATPRLQPLLRLRPNRVSRAVVRAFGFGDHPSPTQVRFVTEMLATSGGPATGDLMRSIFSFDLGGGLGAISVPTLIVAGGRDRMTAVSASRHMAAEIPGAELDVFEGCGHMSFFEEPQRFNAALSAFLKRIPAATGSAGLPDSP